MKELQKWRNKLLPSGYRTQVSPMCFQAISLNYILINWFDDVMIGVAKQDGAIDGNKAKR